MSGLCILTKKMPATVVGCETIYFSGSSLEEPNRSNPTTTVENETKTQRRGNQLHGLVLHYSQ